MNPGDDERPTLPPVRLPEEAELARAALAAPLLARAARLARWAPEGLAVAGDGELPPAQLAAARSHLGLSAGGVGDEEAADAWQFALDAGLVEVREGAAGVEAAPGPALAFLAGGGSPAGVLEIWGAGLEGALTDAAAPPLDGLLGEAADWEAAVGPDGELDPDALDPETLAWAQENAALELGLTLANLYVMAAAGDGAVVGGHGAAVPLPVLAAVVTRADEREEPGEEPGEEALAEVWRVVRTLDAQFRVLAATGLVAYEPPAPGALDDPAGPTAAPAPVEDEDGDEGTDEDARYGRVRLTPLGLYGVRRRLLADGFDAPLTGELASSDAATLLAALALHPEGAAHEEARLWLAGRDPLGAARALLAAARGADPEGPGRRMACQLVLAQLDERAEAAVREVLHDRELGGLARVWLAGRGAPDVPPPGEDMVSWLAIDTLAAELATAPPDVDPAALRELVAELAAHDAAFLDRAWRTDHPAAAEVLEAVGRLHPDKQVAKRARAAAHKSRTRP
ncbi:hypothetical protein RM780_07205 [Streptomyces sp. DSM 44917]|uniref:Uncharacterized protein n=1 Tax=Streptomyces boetiae TaxID=3075541 RepID=A0ABU2L5B5_9ACTN|nr:hypothetical protein [Streptomyces sp. DSM 44917]MDT0306749.1 hypothetical protein [Streptomyces sp. DSM 44917]